MKADGDFLMQWVIGIGIAQGGLDARPWRCPGIRYEGDGNISWNGLLALEFPREVWMPIPGGVKE